MNLCRAATVVLCLSITACGSGTTTVTQQDTASAEQAFIQKADAICKPLNAPLAKFSARFNQAASLAEQAVVYRDYINYSKPYEKQLNELQPPSTLAIRWNQYITASNAQDKAVQREYDAAQAGDAATLDAYVNEVTVEAERRSKAAQQIGFAVCGHD